MGEQPTRLVTKLWLAACLVVLALALVPVYLPLASLHGRYDTPHANRLQRHSFSNVASGRPDGKLSQFVEKPLPYAALSLVLSVFGQPPLAGTAFCAQPLLRTLPHRRKLGRADPGDPEALA